MKRTIISSLILGLSTTLLAGCGSTDSSSGSKMLATTTACYAAWNSTTAYNGGATVSYANVNYTAAYWTQGQNPSTNNGPAGSGQPWISNGACGTSPTPTPAPTPAPTPTPTPTPTPAPATGIISGAVYTLVNPNSNDALDVSGGGTADGTNVQIWTQNGLTPQDWEVNQNSDGTYTLINTNSGKALDVSGSGTTNGTNVQIWTPNGSGAQKWKINSNGDGTVTLVNPNSNDALDINGGGTTAGTNVQIWTQNGSAAQKWQLRLVPGATYTLVNPNSNDALDVSGAGTADGTNVQIWTQNGSAAQSWKINSNSDGTYTLINTNSGKALDVNAAGTAAGTNVQIWTSNGSAAQKWKFNSNTDGTVTVINPNSNDALDVNGAGTTAGTNVQIWTQNGGVAQKWQLHTPMGSPTPTPTPAPTPTPTGWILGWSDEFNGTALDTSKWNYEVNCDGGGNGELQCYTSRPENVSVSGGNLVITARQESYLGHSYTSGRINTSGKFSQTYGRFEARIKIPTGQGTWPAFWMLGQNINSVSWPKCGEIDNQEHVNNDPPNYGTIHWADVNGNHVQYGNQSAALDFTQFHVYAIEWDTNAIKWFVDGVQYGEANIQNNINNTGAFHLPFFMIANLAIGGSWPGSPNGSIPFPQQMLIDYIRVYRK